jgi:GDPmannose 4,6-dehydratase
MKRTALITGITGQDGSYLAQLLLEMGYEVHGVTRRKGNDLGAAAHLAEHLTMHRFDLFDQKGWNSLLANVQPAEFYNFAAESFIPNGCKNPVATHATNVTLPIRILDAIRQLSPETRFLNACSREIFGSCSESHVNENSPMNPRTCYGISKATSRWTVAAYREQYCMFATSAILFNHESPRRSPLFVSRKITSAAARIATGLASSLELGNTNIQRDWGYAADYVEAMWRMLQRETPEDFVLGTGQLHSLQDLVDIAFAAAGLTPDRFVRTNQEYVRSIEPTPVTADISKARQLLDWQPMTRFEDLVTMMVEHDLRICRAQIGRVAAA